MTTRRRQGKFFDSRLWAPFLLAGMLAFSGLLLAGGNEDYETGLKLYQEGDMASAIAPLRKAVDAGDVKAMVLLASILDISEFNEDAVELYRKAANMGEPEGMFGLATMIGSGEGAKKDLLEARRWFEKAAGLGHEQSIRVLAMAYLNGDLGLTEADRNTPEALKWVQQAAKGNFLPAIDALVEAYETGGMLGVSADAKLSDEYLAQANKIRHIDPHKGKKKKRKVPVSKTVSQESVE